MPTGFKRSGKVLWNDVVPAGTGAIVKIDTSFIQQYEALYSVSLESGDWVQIQGALEQNGPWFTQGTVSAAGATLVPIDSPFRYLRVVKTGSAGKARVFLYG